MQKINIAIDGYSACGKSTTAKAVAANLKYTYIDTGAMYRAVTYYLLQNEVDVNDITAVERVLDKIKIGFQYDEGKLRTYLNDVDVEDAIRTPEVAAEVSTVSAISAVRRKLVEEQQRMGKEKGVVMDGRDIGTVVFPDAELKIFMTADTDIRTQRRVEELEQKGTPQSFDAVKENLLHRDHIDSTRADSPLLQAEDAIVVDTSHISPQEQIDEVIRLAEKCLGKD